MTQFHDVSNASTAQGVCTNTAQPSFTTSVAIMPVHGCLMTADAVAGMMDVMPAL